MTTRLSLLLALLLLWMSPAVAFEVPDQARHGEALTLFEIEDTQLRRAVLHFRVAGSRQFVQQPFTQRGSRWQARLNGDSVIIPALEYYAEFHFADGSVKTEPLQYPKYNPKRLAVIPRSAVTIRLASVQDDPQSLLFEVEGELYEDHRIMLDGQDVTYLVARDGGSWRLDNRHGLIQAEMPLQVVDGRGQVVASARIADPAATPKQARDRELVVRGNASLSFGGQNSSDDGASDIAVSGNLHVETEYQDGDFKSHFSGININYEHDAEDEFTLSSGFLFTNTYRQHSLEFGDVSVSGAPLVLSGFARRGLHARTEGEDWKGSLFNVRTSTVDGWESGVSFDDRQTYGASYQQQIGSEGKSSMQVSLVSGELKNPQTDNVGGESSSGQAGDSAGVQFSTELVGVVLDAQLATSRFDADTSDVNSKQSDEAYELNLSRDIYGLASTLGFHHYGANYATIANPNFSNDREGFNVSLGSQIGFLGWQASFSSTEDNVDADPARSVVTSHNTGVNMSLNFQNWPSLQLGFNLSEQQSENEPSADQIVDNEGQDITLGISDQFDKLSVAWSSSLGELTDKQTPGADSETTNHALTFGFSGDALQVDLNLSKNESETDVTLTSDLVNLSASFPLFSDDVRLQTQMSVQDNSASDGSQDNRIAGGSARVGWALQQIFGESLKSLGGGRVGLSYSYNKTEDTLDPSADSSDKRVMLEFSFGAPVDFEYNWQF